MSEPFAFTVSDVQWESETSQALTGSFEPRASQITGIGSAISIVAFVVLIFERISRNAAAVEHS